MVEKPAKSKNNGDGGSYCFTSSGFGFFQTLDAEIVWLGEAEQSAELGLRLKGWGGVDAKILVMCRVVFPAKILVIST